MNKIVSRVMLILLASTMMLTFSIQTAKAEIGIGPGAQIRYGNVSAQAYYAGDGPAPISPRDKGLNETSWVGITAQSIQATNITYEVEQHFNNGSYITFSDWIDVGIGPNPSSRLGFPFFCTENLQAGDNLYNVSRGVLYYGWKINETLQREYLNVTGQTICFNETSSPHLIGASYHYDLFWDKISGVLTEYNYRSRIASPGEPTTEVHFEIIGSSPSWPIPELPSFLILPPFMAATLLTAAICKKRMLKRERSDGTMKSCAKNMAETTVLG